MNNDVKVAVFANERLIRVVKVDRELIPLLALGIELGQEAEGACYHNEDEGDLVLQSSPVIYNLDDVEDSALMDDTEIDDEVARAREKAVKL